MSCFENNYKTAIIPPNCTVLISVYLQLLSEYLIFFLTRHCRSWWWKRKVAMYKHKERRIYVSPRIIALEGYTFKDGVEISSSSSKLKMLFQFVNHAYSDVTAFSSEYRFLADVLVYITRQCVRCRSVWFFRSE